MSAKPLEFPLDRVPFSRRGAWLMWNRLTPVRAAELGKDPALYLRTAHGGVPMPQREIFCFELLTADGNTLTPTREYATPATLHVEASGGACVQSAFAKGEVVRIRGRNCALRLRAEPQTYDYARPAGNDAWEINMFSKRIQFLLTRLAGNVRVYAPWEVERSTAIHVEIFPPSGKPNEPWEIELTAFESTVAPPPAARPSFDALVAEAQAEFDAWLAAVPSVPAEFAQARALAAYVQWASLVEPQGRLRREAMFMSKNWMLNVWTWDHCFNAIGLLPHQPALAWDQWQIAFDYQNPFGALPDCFNDYDIVWNFTKPPIHGWALRQMLRRGFQPSQDQIQTAIAQLERWTDWWLRFRDDDADGIPQYNHGNDSGWDNATIFSHGTPVEGPDLAAFLIVQMDVLAELHHQFGNSERAAQWQTRAAELFERLLRHSVHNGRFVAPRSGDHATANDGDSLVQFIPLLLGKKLPPDLIENSLRLLTEPGKFLTPHGLATESLRSPLYADDSYWRGPIWAPPIALLTDALRSCDRAELAADIARRFCRTVAQSGCAENFNARTGAGLRDQAYTWTASVFLALASELQ